MQEACQWEHWPKKAHRLGRAAAIAAEIPQEMPPWIGRTASPDMLTPPLRVNLSGQSDPDGEFAGEAKYRVSRSSQARPPERTSHWNTFATSRSRPGARMYRQIQARGLAYSGPAPQVACGPQVVSVGCRILVSEGERVGSDSHGGG
jgi:hypothetical protein